MVGPFLICHPHRSWVFRSGDREEGLCSPSRGQPQFPARCLTRGLSQLFQQGLQLCSTEGPPTSVPRGRGLTLDIGHGVPAALTLPDLLRPTADRPVVGAALSQLQTDSSGVCPLWVLLRASSGALQSAPSPEAKAPP